MTPNRVRWEDLDPGTYEDMVSVLISRLHPEAQRIDGSGGDGGRDVQVPTDDGLVIFELKSFTGRMDSSRRRQVAASLERASQHEPVAWHLVVPIDPTQGELDDARVLRLDACETVGSPPHGRWQRPPDWWGFGVADWAAARRPSTSPSVRTARPNRRPDETASLAATNRPRPDPRRPRQA